MKVYNRSVRDQAVKTKSGVVVVKAGQDLAIKDTDFIVPNDRKARAYKNNNCFFSKSALEDHEGTLKSLEEKAAENSKLGKAANTALDEAKVREASAKKLADEAKATFKDAETLAANGAADKVEAEKILEAAKVAGKTKPADKVTADAGKQPNPGSA